MARFSELLLRLVYDGNCRLCGRREPLMKALVCSHCWNRLPTISKPVCRACGFPLRVASAGLSGSCGACFRNRLPQGVCRSFGRYAYGLRDLVLLAKRREGACIARAMGKRASASALRLLDGRPYDLVVPVPLHRSRLRARGHNQSAAIARPLSRALGSELDSDCLRRVIGGHSQTRLSASERRRLPANTFRVRRRHDVGDARVLLVDDVVTTGSTAHRCALALHEAGARVVDLFTIARTMP